MILGRETGAACADFLVELRGFEPMAIASAVSYSSRRRSMRAACSQTSGADATRDWPRVTVAHCCLLQSRARF